MNRGKAYNLEHFAGILFGASSIINFWTKDVLMGVIYLCLAATFILSGYSNKKDNK